MLWQRPQSSRFRCQVSETLLDEIEPLTHEAEVGVGAEVPEVGKDGADLAVG